MPVLFINEGVRIFADKGRNILMVSAFITDASDVLGETHTGLFGRK